MTTTLNQLADRYVGALAILGVVGFALTIISTAMAMYFYYNPKRQKYKIKYKLFAHNFTTALVYAKGLNSSPEGEEYLFDSYVDLWNAGQDSIGADVVRGPIQIYLEPHLTETEIRAVEKSSSITSAVANLAVANVDGRVEVSWDHFDPGEAVRLRVVTNRPLRSRDLALLGKGLRLSIGKGAGDEGGWLREAVVPWIITLAVLGIGTATAWGVLTLFGTLDPESAWYVPLAFPTAVLGFFAVIGAPTAGGVLLANLFSVIFNSKSPIEKLEGVPSVGVPSVVSKQLYMDFLSSLEPQELENLIHRHQIEAAELRHPVRLWQGGAAREGEPGEESPPA